jgi:BirA family transcriptional regulator, biotin operon repressor / biotin---[acetyl-CoA-carboxylase] ligase
MKQGPFRYGRPLLSKNNKMDGASSGEPGSLLPEISTHHFVCLQNRMRSFPLTPFLIASAIHKVLSDLKLDSEFKWPNDILVCRKKVGGVLIEEKADVLIAGIGINVSEAPVMTSLRCSGAVPATHLKAFGVLLTPLELWSSIIQEVMDHIHVFSSNTSSDKLFRALEGRMAFLGEKVVFKTHDARQFPAVVAGLSRNGGIRLKTADGEKILYSGSLFPVIY